MLVLYLIERVQLSGCPGTRSTSPASQPHLAFNTAASFTTNTNWQNYGGESTMSYFTQMAGLAYHNFVSAAVGIALAIAVIRGIARKESKTIGNFWVDMTRCMLWVLLPACLVFALVFVSQGVIQNLQAVRHGEAPESADRADHRRRRQNHHADRHRPDDRAGAHRLAGSHQDLGTNGGGFFNANSAHPFENPTPLTEFLSDRDDASPSARASPTRSAA